jgi:hypothetical protein
LSRLFSCKWKKLKLRDKKGFFIGYPINVKGYKLWCPNLSKNFMSRNITFDESAMLKAHDDAPELIIKENEKIEKKVKFDLPV